MVAGRALEREHRKRVQRDGRRGRKTSQGCCLSKLRAWEAAKRRALSQGSQRRRGWGRPFRLVAEGSRVPWSILLSGEDRSRAADIRRRRHAGARLRMLAGKGNGGQI